MAVGTSTTTEAVLEFPEVPMVDMRELLRLWLRGHALRAIARLSQDRPSLRGGSGANTVAAAAMPIRERWTSLAGNAGLGT